MGGAHPLFLPGDEWRLAREEGALEREESVELERAGGEATARAQAEEGCRGRNAPAPTWPLRRQKTGGSRRLRIGTGGWGANLGRGWARPSDCRSEGRGRWGHRGGGLGRPRGPGPRTRGLPNPGHRRRDWGGRRWGQVAQGQRRDPRKGREDRESGQGCQRREWRQYAGQRQCGCDNGRERERCRKPGHRGAPTTAALEASRGRPRVDRGGGWGGRRNPRESRGARARQTGTDLRQSGAFG